MLPSPYHFPWHLLTDDATRAIAVAGVLHTLLPPWDWRPAFVEEGLADFPAAQRRVYSIFSNRWYKLLVYTVGYVALHARSTVWQGISIKQQVADAKNGGKTP